MTNLEFSLGFDILWNNIMSNIAPGLNPYEKSVFLTKSQSELLKNYFNPKGNKYGEGFGDSSKRDIDFSSLITVISPPQKGEGDFLNGSYSFSLPDNIMFILNETCSVTKDGKQRELVILPVKHQELTRLLSKPFKAPYKNQCWRLLANAEDTTVADIFPGYNCTDCSYKIRYIRYPNPIILESLKNGLTIDGKSDESECELPEEIHQEILQRAVEIAKAAWSGDETASVTIGNRSE